MTVMARLGSWDSLVKKSGLKELSADKMLGAKAKEIAMENMR